MPEIAEMIEKAVNALHEATDRQDGEIRKFGEMTAETKAMVDKINTDLTAALTAKAKYEQVIEEMETKLQRQNLPGVDADGNLPLSEKDAAHQAAFYKYVRQGKEALTPDERKALVEDDTGLYLVEPELDTDIIMALPKITVIRNLAAVRTISKERLKIRSIGGVAVGWGKLETGADIEEGSPVPGTPSYQYVEDLYGLAKIGEDELADSDFDLEPLLAELFSTALGEEEDKQFVLGNGHDSEEPEGITINATLVAATVTGTAAGAVTIEKFLEILYTCPTQYRRNGSFMVNSTVELALRQLREVDIDGGWTGAFLWQPSVALGKPNTFLGKPIYTQDDMPDLSDAAGIIAVFGDFKKGYRIVDRKGMSIQRLTELYSEEGLVGFKVHKRVTGGVMRAGQKPLVLMTEGA